MSTRPVSLILVLGTLLLAGSVSATTVAERSFREITSEAPSIVHGTVVSTSSRWSENRSLILTDVRIRVLDVLKGDQVDEVVVTQPGGTVGKLRVDVAGSETFSPGQETVVFLKPADPGHSQVVGIFQGRFDVVEDARGQKVVQGVSPEHARILRTASSAGTPREEVISGKAVPLGQFLDSVRELIGSIDSQGGR